MCSIALPQAICDACTTMENCATAEEQIVTCISYARISSAPIRTQNMDTVYNVVSGWSIGSRAAPRCPHSRTAIVRAIKEGNRKKTREKQFHCWLNCAEKKKKKNVHGLYTFVGFGATTRAAKSFSYSSFDLYFIDAAKEILCLMILL